MYDIVELNSKLVPELREIAQGLNIPKTDKLLKKDLIYKILDHQALNPTAEMLAKEVKKPAAAPKKRPAKATKPSPAKAKNEPVKRSKENEPVKHSKENESNRGPKENEQKKGRPRKKPEVAASSLPKKDFTVLAEESISGAKKTEPEVKKADGAVAQPERKPEAPARSDNRERDRSRDNRERRDPRDTKDSRDPREKREPREKRDPRDQRDSKTPEIQESPEKDATRIQNIKVVVKALIRIRKDNVKNFLLNLKEWSQLRVFSKLCPMVMVS